MYHPPESAFAPGESDPAKLFGGALLWSEAPLANELCRRFIAACRRVPGVEFEGGFAPFLRHGFEKDIAEFADMRAPRRYPILEFIAKLQRSAASFIVPGVHDCLTWRLGQSLALGKAIIAAPLAREMPVPLEHGRNVHLVDGSEAAIQDALQKICGDAAYRRQLEREARAYYERYLAPKSVVERLLASVDRETGEREARLRPEGVADVVDPRWVDGGVDRHDVEADPGGARQAAAPRSSAAAAAIRRCLRGSTDSAALPKRALLRSRTSTNTSAPRSSAIRSSSAWRR